MGRKFFVEFNTHNGETDAWNYKQTKMFDDYDTARKEFYNCLATYIQFCLTLSAICLTILIGIHPLNRHPNRTKNNRGWLYG